MKNRFCKRASMILEFSVLVAAIGIAMVALMTYVSRAVSGKMRESTDSFGFGRLYEIGSQQQED